MPVMTEVIETQLPGVGVRHDFTTRSGERLGMIVHRTGHRDLLVYDRDDPDACGLVLRLEEDDARTLADVLGAAHVTEEIARLQSVAGLTIDWVPVTRASACAGARLHDLGAASERGATVVAVLRGEETISAPPLDFVLQEGDTAVAVGTAEGVRHLFELLQGSSVDPLPDL